MDTQQKDLSYFRLRLQQLLNTSFPEKAHDQKFIKERSTWAAEAYECAFRYGNSSQQCDYIAEYILFEGLHFSKFDAVFRVVCNEFDTIIVRSRTTKPSRERSRARSATSYAGNVRIAMVISSDLLVEEVMTGTTAYI